MYGQMWNIYHSRQVEVVANSLHVVHMYLNLSFINPTSFNIPNHKNAINKRVIIEMVIFLPYVLEWQIVALKMYNI